MTYRIEKFFLKRTYTLSEKTIEIEQVAKFDTDYKLEFNLSPLYLPHGESKTYESDYNGYVLALGMLVFGSSFFFTEAYTGLEKYMMITLMVSGLFIMGLSSFFRSKTRHAVYYNEDNAYIFEISQSDSSDEAFDEFIAELDKRIKLAKEQPEG